MLLLPRVMKGFKRALTGAEKAKKLMAAVALGFGVGLATVPATDAQAASTVQSVQQTIGSLLFAVPDQSGDMVGKHYSHRSHASHRSHYSSRY